MLVVKYFLADYLLFDSHLYSVLIVSIIWSYIDLENDINLV